MINRNNYEEYLLLYIDGELSSSEQQAVESFLASNPDIKEELQLLQQAILQPETLEFSGKELLYRKDESINHNNYQEYFLLYVDEELSLAEKEAVETFVLQNPGLQEEFTLLKQTVLPKEPVFFKNKEVLYRKEEKRRPVVISMRWASLAAAVMIGIIAMIWVFNSNDKPAGTQEELATKKDQHKQTTTPATTQPQQIITPGNTGDNNDISLTAGKPDGANARISRPVSPAEQKQTPQEQIAVVPKQQIPQQTIVQPEVIASNPNPVNTNAVNPGTSSTTYTGSPEDEKVTRASGPNPGSIDVQPVVYKEDLNTEGEEKNKNLLVGALQINSDKVRGLLRKAGRFFSSKVKNKDDDSDKIQVANLEVNKIK